LDRARHYVSRSQAAATASQMVEYMGMAQANLAWIAWREGDLAQAKTKGQIALDLWRQLPAGHSSSAFQWAALWPLVGVALAQNQISAATEYARALLEPGQQRLPDAVTVAVESAISAWERDESQTASAHLCQALELAQELG